MWLRLNKTRTEVTKTQTEGGWITQLVKDRDDCMAREKEAVDRERALNAKYEELKSENAALKSQATMRDEKIDNLYRRVEMLTNLIIEFRPDLEMFLKSPAFGDLHSQDKGSTVPRDE